MSHRPDVGDAAEALVRMGATKRQVAQYLAEHLAPGEEVACPGCVLTRDDDLNVSCSWCRTRRGTEGIITARQSRTGGTRVLIGAVAANGWRRPPAVRSG